MRDRTVPPAARDASRTVRLAALAVLTVLVAACASGPGRDGPPARPPSGLPGTPDAVPRVEPLRVGGPNRPYEVLGQSYTPMTTDRPLKERGIASWYGRKFHGRRTANGEVYDMYAMTAAHKTMPLPSYARVRNPANGREVIVRVNDRGPFVRGRVIDLSYAAAVRLGIEGGIAPVDVERLTHDDIRSGRWQRDTAPPQAIPLPAPAASPPAPSPQPPMPDLAATPAPSAPPNEALPPVDLPAAEAPTSAAPGFWVQLGAFRERGGAENFQEHVAAELDWLATQMTVFPDAALFRLQAGPYASRSEAQAAAQRVREALQLVPVVIERR